MSRWAALALVAGSMGLVPPGLAQDPAEPPLRTDWCMTDDPATFIALAREADTVDPPALCTQVPAEGGEMFPETLALPLPCGHRMLLRKVHVPADFLLDQRVAAFGSSSGGTVNATFSRGPWDAPVSGVFSEDEDGRPIAGNLDAVSARSFYIGKYELTRLHWALFDDGLFEAGKGLAIDAPECGAASERAGSASPARILPVTGLSWFDAIAFSRDYNAWLFALDRARIEAGLSPVLPWEQGSSGYVRLATEVEWEYAARGGSTGVRPEDRSRQLPRVRDPASGDVRDARLEEVAVVQRVSTGKSPVRGVGTRAPNLLGLHDVVGNAEEIILELFRATRPDMLHGHTGGMLTRGGSALTPTSAIGVGYRRELPMYDLSTGEGRSDLVGARLVVSAPFFVMGADGQVGNAAFEEQLERSRQILQGERAAGGQEADQKREADQKLDSLARALEAQKLDRERIVSQVKELQATLARRDATLADASRRVLRERVRAAIVTGAGIHNTGGLMLEILFKRRGVERKKREWQEQGLLSPKVRERADEALEKLAGQLRQQDKRIGAQYDLFHSLVLELAKADQDDVRRAMREVEREFDSIGLSEFNRKNLAPLRDQVAMASRTDGIIDRRTRELWRAEVDITMLRRQELLSE